MLLVAVSLVGTKHGDRFDFDQQFRAAQLCLYASGRGQWIESLFLEECGALFVEDVVIAVDVTQVATGAHDVVPRAALTRKQPSDVVEGAPHLGAKIADVNAPAFFVDGCRSGNE